jgi:hypothetical protein
MAQDKSCFCLTFNFPHFASGFKPTHNIYVPIAVCWGGAICLGARAQAIWGPDVILVDFGQVWPDVQLRLDF